MIWKRPPRASTRPPYLAKMAGMRSVYFLYATGSMMRERATQYAGMYLPTHPNGAAQLDLSAAMDEVYADRARSAKFAMPIWVNERLNGKLGRIRTKSDHFSSVMPVPGLDPGIVA